MLYCVRTIDVSPQMCTKEILNEVSLHFLSMNNGGLIGCIVPHQISWCILYPGISISWKYPN